MNKISIWSKKEIKPILIKGNKVLFEYLNCEGNLDKCYFVTNIVTIENDSYVTTHGKWFDKFRGFKGNPLKEAKSYFYKYN